MCEVFAAAGSYMVPLLGAACQLPSHAAPRLACTYHALLQTAVEFSSSSSSSTNWTFAFYAALNNRR
jgi:hypothetical protein